MTSSRFDRSLVEGPIPSAVWKLAWPTILQNLIGGLQGIIDHALVGHFVGYTANAGIGVSWQIVIVGSPSSSRSTPGWACWSHASPARTAPTR